LFTIQPLFLSNNTGTEKGRYHLYISYACPWAHRTMIFRTVKGLEDCISFSVVEPINITRGWEFSETHPDHLFGARDLREIYLKADPNYNGTISVPVLFDKKGNCIVNNESSEIIRMFNTEFNEFAANKELDLYPVDLRDQIDELNNWIYPGINNGVYRCGFAKKQDAYLAAFKELFESMDRVESILSKKRYLTGNTLTEADIRLFVTLLRFDSVYYVHFKCNGRRVTEYPNMWEFVREIYQTENIKGTINIKEIKQHYYCSHLTINPLQIIAEGPLDLNFELPHKRASKFSTSGF